MPHVPTRSRRRAPSPRFCNPEPLERRLQMSGDAAAVEAPDVDNNPPTVEAVYVRSTDWTEPFLEFIEYTRQGSDEFGYEVQPSGAGGGSGGGRDILPWFNLNQLSIQFDEPVSVQQNDLTITSAAGRTYNTTAFAYDADTNTATWTLDRQVSDADVLTLRLDGDSPTGVTDLAGNPLHGNDSRGDDDDGGSGPPARDFLQTLSVLPGDTNRDGRVLARDFTEVRRRFFSSTTNVDGSYERYSIFHDTDGSGIILARDAVEVRKRFFTELPDEDDDDNDD